MNTFIGAQKKGQRASVRRCISPTEIKQWARARLLAHTRAIRKFVCGLSLSWVSALLSLLFIILTIAYAFYPQSVSHLKAIGGSPSSALVVLRILSEVAGVLLAATTAAAFEKLQFTLVAREGDGGGLRFLDYLSLQAGAGVPGLMGIVFWRGDIKMATRVWSIVRLISIVLVPILNIVAMSKFYIRIVSLCLIPHLFSCLRNISPYTSCNLFLIVHPHGLSGITSLI